LFLPVGILASLCELAYFLGWLIETMVMKIEAIAIWLRMAGFDIVSDPFCSSPFLFFIRGETSEPGPLISSIF
jgi:hypothetical protein